MRHGRPIRPLLAAPILGERGGGVGQVSQMLWQSLQDTWSGGAELVTLLKNGHDRPGTVEKLRFGSTIATRQAFERPDWILFSHLGLARTERFVPAAWQSPYAIFLHGIECWDTLSPSDLAILNRATLRIANSDFTAQRAATANPGLRRIAVCPLALPGTPPPFVSAVRAEPVVLVVGRLSSTERYKGHAELIQAWPAVVACVPAARLVIVGDGDDLPALRQLAEHHRVAAAVEFKGFLTREQLEAEYRRAAVFALPSRNEGFGLVYLEAMAHGLPCIGSKHDAAGEVIVDGVTGILVDPADRESVGRSLCDLLQQPGRRKVLGEAGRARLLERFTYERFRHDVVALLQEAFDDDSAGDRA